MRDENLICTHIFSKDGTLLLSDKVCSDSGAAYDRDDVKITLKLFMETFEYSQLDDAVESVLSQLKTDSIEQLILAFPVKGSYIFS